MSLFKFNRESFLAVEVAAGYLGLCKKQTMQYIAQSKTFPREVELTRNSISTIANVFNSKHASLPDIPKASTEITVKQWFDTHRTICDNIMGSKLPFTAVEFTPHAEHRVGCDYTMTIRVKYDENGCAVYKTITFVLQGNQTRESEIQTCQDYHRERAGKERLQQMDMLKATVDRVQLELLKREDLLNSDPDDVCERVIDTVIGGYVITNSDDIYIIELQKVLDLLAKYESETKPENRSDTGFDGMVTKLVLENPEEYQISNFFTRAIKSKKMEWESSWVTQWRTDMALYKSWIARAKELKETKDAGSENDT